MRRVKVLGVKNLRINVMHFFCIKLVLIMRSTFVAIYLRKIISIETKRKKRKIYKKKGARLGQI